MKTNRASLALGLGIMALSAAAIYIAREWPIKAALFPLAIGIPLFVLATMEVLLGFFAPSNKAQGAPAQPDQEQVEDAPTGKLLSAIGWVLGFCATVVLLGFPIAIPLYVLVYVKTQGQTGWGWAGVYAFVVWAVFYGVFDRLLHLPFPAGWIQTALGLI